ncbi:protein of unknown function [Candidatus Nitrosocaldus cavascurensis]|uniref:Uncharacterized protein n=1 Tax=Candidatus Nitrosocaldus cavascurensis TaxID=2058097 RepID=A0A2K5ARQ7_9ARCH|nr:protein of unknown function [Candidatus Nitrosocaldus cavascurensis]
MLSYLLPEVMHKRSTVINNKTMLMINRLLNGLIMMLRYV